MRFAVSLIALVIFSGSCSSEPEPPPTYRSPQGKYIAPQCDAGKGGALFYEGHYVKSWHEGYQPTWYVDADYTHGGHRWFAYQLMYSPWHGLENVGTVVPDGVRFIEPGIPIARQICALAQEAAAAGCTVGCILPGHSDGRYEGKYDNT